MTEFYSPGQLSVIYPFLGDFVPKWLLLGGPADANEAQTAREKWPDIQIIGVEPNRDAITFQKSNGWPKDAPLICGVLDDVNGQTRFLSNDTGSLRHQRVSTDKVVGTAVSITWDRIDSMLGPIEDALIWMDIEGREMLALEGADELLLRSGVKAINVEMQSTSDSQRNLNKCLELLMRNRGFKAVHEWNKSPQCWDRIYIR